MGYLSSGNEVVDQIATLQISGNVIHPRWYKTIRKENGKAYHLAVSILSDIVYWYRPVEVRDEATGHIVGLKKKFQKDMLQKSYESYANFYGESKKVIKEAIDRLVDLGVVVREFRNVEMQGGLMLYNTMFLSVNPLRLYELTYNEDEEDNINDGYNGYGDEDFDIPGDMPEDDQYSTCGHYVHKLDDQTLVNGLKPSNRAASSGGPSETGTTPLQKSKEGMPKIEGGADETGTTSLQKSGYPMPKWVGPHTKNGRTNTEITTENTTEITSTSPAPFDDESVRAVFAGLNLNDHDICCILSASDENLEKCRKAVEALKKQKTKISNVTGWLINAVRQNFEVSNWVGYKPRNNQAGSFGNFQQREIDFDELYKRVYAN